MDDNAIPKIDQATLTLLEAIETYAEDVAPYIELHCLNRLRSDLINLRKELLGLEMGILYKDWKTPPEMLEKVVKSNSNVPLDEAAAQVAQMRGAEDKD